MAIAFNLHVKIKGILINDKKEMFNYRQLEALKSFSKKDAIVCLFVISLLFNCAYGKSIIAI